MTIQCTCFFHSILSLKVYDFTSTANSQQIDYSFELFDLISMTCKSLDNGKLSFYCNYYNMKSFGHPYFCQS